ncbi:MAG: hypothetical protein HY816_09370 [Candidatus Wallbacteria bacterium]|nr:hypothetical protein [Candidatus Wallbacteria bacterium]
MTQQALDRILAEYAERTGTYLALTRKVERVLIGLLEKARIAVHAVSSRVKQRSRLRAKLEAPGNKYQQLSELTDISGVRVITYFHDHVEAVSALIEREFRIDEENSVDKGELLDPDRFGYLSRHYVVELPSRHLTVKERERFRGCRCEIQIRSILQHAWAEIEHDLGYKTKEAVPREIRRSFSRLAGLLEIADGEFVRIRETLAAFAQDVASKIEAGLQGLSIDKPALWGFIRRSPVVTHWDEQIRATVGASAVEELEAVEQWIPIFRAAGFDTIGDLEKAVAHHGPLLPGFARHFRRSMGRYDDILPIARGLSVIRAVDAQLATSGFDTMKRAYASSGRRVSADYLDRLFQAFTAARTAGAAPGTP